VGMDGWGFSIVLLTGLRGEFRWNGGSVSCLLTVKIHNTI
jgi:hypothetical protein